VRASRAIDPIRTSAVRRFRCLRWSKSWHTRKGAHPPEWRAWPAQPPRITSPILDLHSRGQLEEPLGAVHVELTTKDLARHAGVAPLGWAIVPYVEADFSPRRFPW
jgi:hypothetical protein